MRNFRFYALFYSDYSDYSHIYMTVAKDAMFTTTGYLLGIKILLSKQYKQSNLLFLSVGKVYSLQKYFPF